MSLVPCLRDYFRGPSGGGADNQVAINVQCLANSCLCTPENIEENLLHISSQVSKRCTASKDKRIAIATSVLSGYCSMMTAGLTTTTLGGGSPKQTSKPTPTPKPKTKSNDNPPPDDDSLPSDDGLDEDPPRGGTRIGPLSLAAFLGIVIPAGFAGIMICIGLRSLYYAKKAHQWREARS